MEVVAGRRSGHCRAVRIVPDPEAEEVAAWAASGAMALTGRADGPALGPPSGLVPKLRTLGERLGEAARALGGALEVDPLALLAERAAIAGLRRRGTTSCGGASRLLPCRDGWFVLSLARPEDVALVPAWLELSDVPAEPVGSSSRRRSRRGRVTSSSSGLVSSVCPPPGCRRRAGGAPGCRSRPSSAPRTRSPTSRGRAGRGAGVPVGGPLCGSLLAARRGRRGQGGVDRPARRRSPRPTGLLRPPQRRQAQRRARPDDRRQGWTRSARWSRPPTW